MCNLNLVEDEVHYLFHCPVYSEYRVELYGKLLDLSGGSIDMRMLGIGIGSSSSSGSGSSPGRGSGVTGTAGAVIDRKLIDLILGSGLSTMNSNCRSAIKSYLGKCSIRREKLLKERISVLVHDQNRVVPSVIPRSAVSSVVSVSAAIESIELVSEKAIGISTDAALQ